MTATVSSGPTAAEFGKLAARLRGSLVLPDDDEFARLRKPVLGQLAELLPQAVARCATSEDVVEALAFARASDLPFAVRSGAHSFADFSATDGLLIDVGGMDQVRPHGQTVTVGPGVRMFQLAAQLAPLDRIAPCGWCPTVAISGSVLGGGYGVLSRRYGLGCDHLVAAEVVLADGQVVWVDAEREPDLFWALRGAGGGNFGVVTSLELQTYPAPRVTRFVHHWPLSRAVDVIDAWQRWAPDAPPDVNAELVLASDFRREQEPRVVLFGAVVGPAAKARPVVEAFLATAAPGVDLEELTELSPRAAPCRHSYAGRPEPTMIEPGPPGPVRPRLRAVKSEFFDRLLPGEAIEALVATFESNRPDMQYRELELVPWGGAFARVAPDETAFFHRRQRFMIGHHAIVPNMVGDEGRTEALAWVRKSWQTVHPFASGAVYPNYPDRELTDWARAYYGDNLPRLSAVKQQYDPHEVFRYSQSVPLPNVTGG